MNSLQVRQRCLVDEELYTPISEIYTLCYIREETHSYLVYSLYLNFIHHFSKEKNNTLFSSMERSVLYCSDDDTDTDTVPCIPNYPLGKFLEVVCDFNHKMQSFSILKF